MTVWNRVQGDVNDTAVVGLAGVADITDANVVAHVENNGDRVALTGAVTNAIATGGSLCSVTIQLTPWLATAGPLDDDPYAERVWQFEQQVTLGGVTRTWPEGQRDEIHVRTPGDP